MQQTSKKRIRIDLNRFKLHICLDDVTELNIHFNSASRRFYLSVIALLVMEMKKQGKLFSVPLAKHLKLLALLNDGAILTIAYDRVEDSDQPEKWNLPVVIGVATLLGIAGVFASFGLFYLGERVYLAAGEPKVFVEMQGGHNGGFLQT